MRVHACMLDEEGPLSPGGRSLRRSDDAMFSHPLLFELRWSLLIHLLDNSLAPRLFGSMRSPTHQLHRRRGGFAYSSKPGI